MQPIGVGLISVHRLVSRISNDHVYTTDLNEANVLAQCGSHQYDGAVFQILAQVMPGAVPLMRFVRANGTHFFDAQNPSPVDPMARCESTLGFVMNLTAPQMIPLYLWIHPQNGLFFYTTHPQGEMAAQLGYAPQGAKAFVFPAR